MYRAAPSRKSDPTWPFVSARKARVAPLVMSIAPTFMRLSAPMAVNSPLRYKVFPESCMAFTIAPAFNVVVGDAASAPVVASTAAKPGRAVPEAVVKMPPTNTVLPLTATA